MYENAWTEESNYWGFQTIAIEDLSRIADSDARLVAFEPIPSDVLPKIMQSPFGKASRSQGRDIFQSFPLL